MDDALRTTLWNVLTTHAWERAKYSSDAGYYGGGISLLAEANRELRSLCRLMWIHLFKLPIDQLSDDWPKTLSRLRSHFFGCPWYEVYDFIEFVAHNYDLHKFKDRFITSCNVVLEREVSGYRFVDGVIAPIVDEQEINAIEDAITASPGPVSAHMNRALELMADRQAPDYRNSIKESISGVESVVAGTVGQAGTLGQLIKKMEQDTQLHPALAGAFSKLYGYTSDEGGIRHALLETEKVGFDEAKFFLVACSAFINYVRSKVAAGTHADAAAATVPATR